MGIRVESRLAWAVVCDECEYEGPTQIREEDARSLAKAHRAIVHAPPRMERKQ